MVSQTENLILLYKNAVKYNLYSNLCKKINVIPVWKHFAN